MLTSQIINKINISKSNNPSFSKFDNYIDSTGRINEKLYTKFNKSDIVSTTSELLPSDTNTYSALKVNEMLKENTTNFVVDQIYDDETGLTDDLIFVKSNNFYTLKHKVDDNYEMYTVNVGSTVYVKNIQNVFYLNSYTETTPRNQLWYNDININDFNNKVIQINKDGIIISNNLNNNVIYTDNIELSEYTTNTTIINNGNQYFVFKLRDSNDATLNIITVNDNNTSQKEIIFTNPNVINYRNLFIIDNKLFITHNRSGTSSERLGFEFIYDIDYLNSLNNNTIISDLTNIELYETTDIPYKLYYMFKSNDNYYGISIKSGDYIEYYKIIVNSNENNTYKVKYIKIFTDNGNFHELNNMLLKTNDNKYIFNIIEQNTPAIYSYILEDDTYTKSIHNITVENYNSTGYMTQKDNNVYIVSNINDSQKLIIYNLDTDQENVKTLNDTVSGYEFCKGLFVYDNKLLLTHKTTEYGKNGIDKMYYLNFDEINEQENLTLNTFLEFNENLYSYNYNINIINQLYFLLTVSSKEYYKISYYNLGNITLTPDKTNFYGVMEINSNSGRIYKEPKNYNDITNKSYVDETIVNIGNELFVHKEEQETVKLTNQNITLESKGTIKTKELTVENYLNNNYEYTNTIDFNMNYNKKIVLTNDIQHLFYVSSNNKLIWITINRLNEIIKYNIITIDNIPIRAIHIINNIVFLVLYQDKSRFIYFDYTSIDRTNTEINISISSLPSNIIYIDPTLIENNNLVYINDKTFDNETDSVITQITNSGISLTGSNSTCSSYTLTYNNEFYYFISFRVLTDYKEFSLITKFNFNENKFDIVNYYYTHLESGVSHSHQINPSRYLIYTIDNNPYVIFYYNDNNYEHLSDIMILSSINNNRYMYYNCLQGSSNVLSSYQDEIININNKYYILDKDPDTNDHFPYKKLYKINIDDTNVYYETSTIDPKITYIDENKTIPNITLTEITGLIDINKNYMCCANVDNKLYLSYNDNDSFKIDCIEENNNQLELIENVLEFENIQAEKLSCSNNVFITYTSEPNKIYLKSYNNFYCKINEENFLYKDVKITDDKTIINSKLELYEGTIKTDPVNDYDIVNKKFVDNTIKDAKIPLKNITDYSKPLPIETKYYNWNEITLSNTYNLNSVCYGDNKYYAVGNDGNNGIVLYSDDGITWNKESSTILNNITNLGSICYGYYYNKGNVLLTIYITNAPGNQYNYNIIYKNSNNEWIKRNGIYQERYNYINKSMCHNGEYFVCVGYYEDTNQNKHGMVFYNYSDYDDDWGYTNTDLNPDSIPSDITELNSVCWGNDKFVAVGNCVSYSIEEDQGSWTSKPGWFWHKGTITGTSSNNWKSVCYGKNKFIAVGDGVIYSNDGINWINEDINGLSEGNIWDSICYSNGMFIMVSGTKSDSNTNNKYAYSFDGINWIESDISETERNWKSLCYGNNGYITVSNNSNVIGFENGTLYDATLYGNLNVNSLSTDNLKVDNISVDNLKVDNISLIMNTDHTGEDFS